MRLPLTLTHQFNNIITISIHKIRYIRITLKIFLIIMLHFIFVSFLHFTTPNKFRNIIFTTHHNSPINPHDTISQANGTRNIEHTIVQ